MGGEVEEESVPLHGEKVAGLWSKRAILIGLVVTFATASLLFLCCKQSNYGEQRSKISRTPIDSFDIAWENSTINSWAHSELGRLRNVTDFRDFSVKLRLFKQVFQHHEEGNPLIDSEYPEGSILKEMEPILFPWLHQYYSTLLQMKRSFGGAGIVIPTGSHHFRMAVHLVRSLRAIGCTLPICIAHGGSNDLKPQELFYLYQLRATALDVSKFVDTRMLELKGWQIKPFALLVAPFSEVILLDADVVVMQDPTKLLQDPGYKEHGAIYFRDRTLFEKDWKKTLWLDNNLPSPLSPMVRETRMYQQLSGHELESGMIVLDKGRRLFSILAACKMNGKVERDEVVYKEFYGDKETFWIGAEMAGETYTTLWPRAGVIGHTHDLLLTKWEKEREEWERENKDGKKGKKTKKKERGPKKPSEKGPLVVCGRIAHFDRDGEPLWFNGGIVIDKGADGKKDYLNTFTHYAHEGKWDFATGCIVDVEPISIPQNISRALSEIGRLWRPKINLLDMEKF